MNRYSLLLLVTAMIGFFSCKKIQENKIINGKWEVQKVELNYQDANVMELFLQGYQSNSQCCQYIVDFRDDNTCSGTYYNTDTIVYTVEGTWEMVEFNLVYVNLDRYVNAELDVDRHSRSYYTLFSENNNVAIFNDSIPTTLEIKRID